MEKSIKTKWTCTLIDTIPLYKIMELTFPSSSGHFGKLMSSPRPCPSSFYKGVVPLWMRQIPYTMMKFACFERTVELLYKFVVPKPRSECSKPEQLVVTFVAGYIGK